MNDERYELPEGWLWAALGDVVSIGSTQVLPKRTPEEPFNYLALEHIEPGTGRILNFNPTLGRNIGSNKYTFRVGDVLYGKLRPYLRKATVARFDGVSATDLIPLRSIGPVDASYLQRYLLSPQALNYVHPLMAGIKMPRLRSGDLRVMPIPLAPVSEQWRIVAKIEALFEQSRTARQALDRILPLLKKFRQAVLAAAFCGNVTRDWREQHPDLEPASALLERIRTARRRKWEEDFRSRGKARRHEEHEDPMTLEFVGLGSLPDRWVWSTIGQLFEVSTGGTPSRKKAAYWNGSIPWVSSGEVAFSRICDTREKITEDGLSNSNAKVHPPGTVLLAMIGEGKTRGQSAILDISASTNQNVAAILCSDSAVPSEFVYYWLRYHYEETRTFGEGGAQPALNATKVKTLPVPLPPLAEQRTIIEQLSTLFDQADAIEVAVEAARRQPDKIDQSILARAFRGELVPQDPNDEPASVFLDRISAGRGEVATGKAFPAHVQRGRKR